MDKEIRRAIDLTPQTDALFSSDGITVCGMAVLCEKLERAVNEGSLLIAMLREGKQVEDVFFDMCDNFVAQNPWPTKVC